MNTRSYRTYQVLILAALGLFLMSKVVDGRILLYINPRFVLLVLLAGVGLVALAQVILRERSSADSSGDEDSSHHHASGSSRTWTLWLLALPILLGLLIPERPLGASTLQNRGINTGAGLTARSGDAAQAVAVPPQQRTVLDWIRVTNEGALAAGDTADVTGFVYHDPRLEPGQFLVGRFSIACCVADAVALGMIVDWEDAAGLPDNRWVRVRGRVQPFELDGRTLPLIEVEQVDLIPAPEQPYLFP